MSVPKFALMISGNMEQPLHVSRVDLTLQKKVYFISLPKNNLCVCMKNVYLNKEHIIGTNINSFASENIIVHAHVSTFSHILI